MGDSIEWAVVALHAAFPPHPLDPDVAHDDWKLGATNSTAFMDAVRGRAWDELPPTLLEQHHDALAMLGPTAWKEILPAFVTATLRNDPSLHMVQNFVTGALTRDLGMTKYFEARTSLLTSEQKAAITQALRAWRNAPHGSYYAQLIDQALDSYWQSEETR